MNKPDRIGTYRFTEGGVLESSVSLTKNNYPSFNVRLHLTEYYDEAEGEWVDWTPYEVEISSYFCLFGMGSKSQKIEPTLNHQQVMKVFNWEGKSFQILANDDYSKISGQIRLVENDPEFADRNPFQVAFLDVYDADPSSQLRKLDAGELKKLDASFAKLLQNTGQAPKAATVPAKKSTRPKPPKATKPKKETEESETKEDKQAKMKEKSERLKKAAEAKKKNEPPQRPATLPPESSPQTDTVGFTKQQAWEFCVEMKNDDCDDGQLNATWGGAINQVAGDDVPDDQITKEQWHQIANQVIDEVGKF
jgi:hypothetical protein